MKSKSLILLSLITVFSFTVIANPPAKKCPKSGGCHGDANSPKCKKTKKLSLLKNRNTQPDPQDINDNVSLMDMYNSKDDTSEFDQSQAVTIEGYLFEARDEKGEACNCFSTNAADHDIHVYIAKDKKAKTIGDCVVVELTPYSKHLLPGWTAAYINQSKWMKVEITGWLMYDWEHNNMSFASGQPKSKAKRRTVWEVHPITNIHSL